MKEWLLKTEDGKYHYYRDDMDCCPKYVEKIEIPEGAEFFVLRKKTDLNPFFAKWNGETFDTYGACVGFGWYRESSLRNLEINYKIAWSRGDSVFNDESGIINEETKTLDDKVNQPNHYANFSIECIDAMQAMLSRDEFIGYLRGNIFKYLWRYKLKNGVEDLKKAQWYQNKLIEVEENE